MTGKPSISIEEFLTRYEQYDARRRARHIPEPSKAGFIEGWDDAGLGMTKQSFYNYCRRYNLPWPVLPLDTNVLVCLVFGQSPFDLTWVRQSVAAALNRSVEDLVGQPSVEVLRHGLRFDAETEARLRRLKEDPTFKVATLKDVWLDVADGCRQSTRMEIRYTGPHTDRFYFSAHPIGPPYALEAGDVFNVDPSYIYEMRRVPVGVIAQRLDGF